MTKGNKQSSEFSCFKTCFENTYFVAFKGMGRKYFAFYQRNMNRIAKKRFAIIIIFMESFDQTDETLPKIATDKCTILKPKPKKRIIRFYSFFHSLIECFSCSFEWLQSPWVLIRITFRILQHCNQYVTNCWNDSCVHSINRNQWNISANQFDMLQRDEMNLIIKWTSNNEWIDFLLLKL